MLGHEMYIQHLHIIFVHSLIATVFVYIQQCAYLHSLQS